MLKRIRDYAKTVVYVGGAVGTVAAALQLAGPMAATALVTGAGAVGAVFGGQWLAREIRAVRAAVEVVGYELGPNGSEGRLPAAERGKPLRELMVMCRLDLARGGERLAGLERWVAEHEERHAGEAGGGS